MSLNVSKTCAYAVIQPNTANAAVSKSIGYSIVRPNATQAAISKSIAYAVISPIIIYPPPFGHFRFSSFNRSSVQPEETPQTNFFPAPPIFASFSDPGSFPSRNFNRSPDYINLEFFGQTIDAANFFSIPDFRSQKTLFQKPEHPEFVLFNTIMAFPEFPEFKSWPRKQVIIDGGEQYSGPFVGKPYSFGIIIT